MRESGSLALDSRKEIKSLSIRPENQEPRCWPKVRKNRGSSQAFLNLRELRVPFFYLHSRGKDFNSVFARHSDDDCWARVPGPAIVVTTDPATVSSSTGVSWWCHLTPPRVAKRQPGCAHFSSASCWHVGWRGGRGRRGRRRET